MQSKHSFVSESEDIGGTYPGGLRALGHFRGIPPMAGGQGSALGPGSIPGSADWLVIPHKTDLLAGQRRRALAKNKITNPQRHSAPLGVFCITFM